VDEDDLPSSVGRVTAEFKQAAKAAYRAPWVAMARVLRDDLVARDEKLYPTVVRSALRKTLRSVLRICTVHRTHRRVIQTTNLLERRLSDS
jgi:transposase-like protein